MKDKFLNVNLNSNISNLNSTDNNKINIRTNNRKDIKSKDNVDQAMKKYSGMKTFLKAMGITIDNKKNG